MIECVTVCTVLCSDEQMMTAILGILSVKSVHAR
jgi:hypothetical protein